MTPEQFFEAFRRKLEQSQDDFLTIIEVETENFVDDNFEREGYTDTGFTAWQPRKDPKNDRKLLNKSGDLKRAATTARRNHRFVEFILNQPYAQPHNEGSDRMPKRQYIGRSIVLEKKVYDKIMNRIGHILTTI
jgi:phage gpG-like protein